MWPFAKTSDVSPRAAPPADGASEDDASEDARHVLGRFGEAHAAKLLRRSGFRVRARNVHLRGAEIDLIAMRRARRGHPALLAIVEVRTRTVGSAVRPEESVNAPKQRRLIAAAREYVQRENLGAVAVRFDVIAIEVDGTGRRPTVVRADHHERAFEPSPSPSRGRR